MCFNFKTVPKPYKLIYWSLIVKSYGLWVVFYKVAISYKCVYLVLSSYIQV